MLAVGAVAPVALDGHHLFGYRGCLVGAAEADHVSQTRKCVRLPMGHAHAAAHRDIVADNGSIFGDGDEADVVGEDVHVV